MTIELVGPADVYPLRREVLRGHRPEAPVATAGDDEEGAIHLRSCLDGEAVAVVSLFPSACPHREPGSHWQLVGMAVRDGYQGRGLGSALLQEALSRVVVAGGDLVWAKARDTAADFYRQHGFVTIGDGFDHVGLGHHVMVRDRL